MPIAARRSLADPEFARFGLLDVVRELAEKAKLDVQEILEIEQDPRCEPEPDAVYKLASVFKLPAKPLLELAGLVEARTPRLREEAVRFAARSESVAALNEHEREAFEAFVSAIAESIPPKK